MKNYLFLFIGIMLVACSSKEEKVIESKSETSSSNHKGLPNLPKEMMFCGQKINLEDEDILERLDRELLVNVYFHSSTIQAMKRANRYFPEIEKILKEKGIPEDFKYLAVIESGLVQAVSPAGAQGFWQFMPGTAKEHNLFMSEEVDERLNIEKSTYAACDYLSYAHDTLNDWVLAAASYNRGIGGVRSDMRWQETDNYFDTHMNHETGRYVFRILAMKLIFESPEEYGYFIEKDQLYKPFQTVSVTVKESIEDLSSWAKLKGFNYKILKKLNPWIQGNKLTVKANDFKILLPAKNFNLKPYSDYQ